MTTSSHANVPIPDNWDELDSHNVYYEYIALCREELRAGKKLPPMFRPRERGDAP
jgi:hypothetical protein